MFASIPAFLAVLVLLAGCDAGEDAWGRYLETGRFEGGPPSMSPATGRIVFASPRSGRGDLYECGGPSGPRRLTSDPAYESHPLYSPDGKTIVYAREEGGWTNLWSMSSDGSNPTRLTDGRFLDVPCEFSPDGSLLSFIRVFPSGGASRTAEWWRIDVDGGNPGKVPPGAPTPQIATRELTVAGNAIVDFGPPGSVRALLREFPSGRTMELPLPEGVLSSPRASHDGRKVLFISHRRGEDDVEVYELDVASRSIIRRH